MWLVLVSVSEMFSPSVYTRYTVLWSNSLCLNVLGDSDPLSLRVMCVRDISIAGVGLKCSHSIHIKARKA